MIVKRSGILIQSFKLKINHIYIKLKKISIFKMMCIIYFFMNDDVYILVSKHSIKIHQKKNMLVGGHIQNYQIHLEKIKRIYFALRMFFSQRKLVIFNLFIFYK